MMKDIKLEMICPFCNETHSVEVFEIDYINWSNGTSAQFAFPYLNATQREQLISHLCPKCQSSIFD